MTSQESRPIANAEGGFLQRGFRQVVETIGNAALLGAAVVAAGFAFTEVIHDFDEHLAIPFDNDEV